MVSEGLKATTIDDNAGPEVPNWHQKVTEKSWLARHGDAQMMVKWSDLLFILTC